MLIVPVRRFVSHGAYVISTRKKSPLYPEMTYLSRVSWKYIETVGTIPEYKFGINCVREMCIRFKCIYKLHRKANYSATSIIGPQTGPS